MTKWIYTFGESGEPDELSEKYKIKEKDIVLAAKLAIKRKKELK